MGVSTATGRTRTVPVIDIQEDGITFTGELDRQGVQTVAQEVATLAEERLSLVGREMIVVEGNSNMVKFHASPPLQEEEVEAMWREARKRGW
jgi:hypothetical protein